MDPLELLTQAAEQLAAMPGPDDAADRALEHVDAALAILAPPDDQQ